ncbi:MAG: undecaprenyl-diphosphatase UppP [Fimbriimonadaceae bacterium]
MDLIQALVLGIIQGLTEFLPISSTAHLRVVPALLEWEDPGAAFTAVIQLGTLLAVLFYFWKDLSRTLIAWLQSFSGKASKDSRLGWAIFIGTIPIVVAGYLYKDQIKGESVRSLTVIAWMLIGMGMLLFFADRLASHRKTVEQAGVLDGLWVGLWQAIALIPGASRSGSTITGAFFAGFDRAAAAKFAFLLSVPSVLAAGILELVEERKKILDENLANVLVATAAAFVVGYWSIGFLIRFLSKHSALAFVIYRVALGVLLLVLLQSGYLKQ